MRVPSPRARDTRGGTSRHRLIPTEYMGAVNRSVDGIDDLRVGPVQGRTGCATVPDDVIESLADLYPPLLDGRGGGDQALGDLCYRRSGARRLAGETLVQRTAQAVEVAPALQFFVGDLLRAQVGRGADHQRWPRAGGVWCPGPGTRWPCAPPRPSSRSMR